VLDATGQLNTLDPTSDAHVGRLIYQVSNRGTVDEIQRTSLSRADNGAIRLFHAKSDKETIAAWKLDLIRVLQIFNVSSFGPFQQSLTAPSLSDQAGNQYNLDGDGYPSSRADRSGRY